MPVTEVDVVVVGAGTAGANAAAQLARRGRSVVLLERRAVDDGGAQWCNGVLDRQFVRAGLEPPSGAERVDEHGDVHLRTAADEAAVVVRASPVVGVDMARLGARLRADAAAAGVEVVDRAGDLEVAEVDGRIRAVSIERSGGRRRFEAALFVDASGRRGVLRDRSTVLRSWCPPVDDADVCTATDVEFAVADPDGARRTLDRWGAAPGDAVNLLGLSGGWSTRSVLVRPDLATVRVLVGAIADGRHATAPKLLDDARRAHPWIGERIHGGAGLIPLRRPYARFTAPGLALVGDAAAQVCAVHGSGVGSGLVAGTVLAEAVGGAADPGSEASTWAYQAAFQAELGPDLAFFDGFRRLSVALGEAGVRDLLRSGLLSEPLARGGLDQARVRPPVADLPRLGATLARHRRTAARLVPALARFEAAASVAGRPVREPDEAALRRWDHRLTRLLGA